MNVPGNDKDLSCNAIQKQIVLAAWTPDSSVGVLLTNDSGQDSTSFPEAASKVSGKAIAPYRNEILRSVPDNYCFLSPPNNV